jgi:hypothetical protein
MLLSWFVVAVLFFGTLCTAEHSKSSSSSSLSSFPLDQYLPHLQSLDHISPCLKFLLNVTQDCTNPRHYYFITPMGVGQGFASEFAVNYVYALISATGIGARLIETAVHSRTWEYNCQDHKGWKCYLSSPPCEDSFRKIDQLDLGFYEFLGMHHTNHLNVNRQLEREIPKIQDKLNNARRFLLNPEMRPPITATADQKEVLKACDYKTIPDNELLGTFSQYLFQLNGSTVKKLSELLSKEFSSFQELFVRPFSPSSSSSTPVAPFHNYFGIHLRTNDKRYEMPEAKWNFVTSVDAMSGFLWPVIQTNKLQNIFVASDNCSLACEIKDNLRKLSMTDTAANGGGGGKEELKFVGICFLNNLCDKKPIPVENPRQREDKENETYHLLLEMFLLLHSTVFSGLRDSNIPRLINTLRFRRYPAAVFF